MPVRLECDRCGSADIPERTTRTTGGTQCPACGAKASPVRRNGLAWHPEV
ncbi:hypothetical protein C487_16459 [Natrinema pallidum DSM 3751]|uniref:Uncharacterized protein n=1 Tax=Natrinema pallidum DSM 3751 TaxID=1227495 RepID=L9YIU7_9EURY|nr:hypothetical protein C487_16459 [Natrinema pallidum DSM 3751]